MRDDNSNKSPKITSIRTVWLLIRFVTPYKKHFAILLTLALLTSFLRPAQPFLIQIAIDQYIFKGNYSGLLIICGWMAAVLALQTYFTYAHTYLAEWLGQTVIRDIRSKLFAHTLRLQLKFYDKTPLGHLITRNISDVQTLSNIYRRRSFFNHHINPYVIYSLATHACEPIADAIAYMEFVYF